MKRILFYNVSEPYLEKYKDVKYIYVKSLNFTWGHHISFEDASGLIFSHMLKISFTKKNIEEFLKQHFNVVNIAV